MLDYNYGIQEYIKINIGKFLPSTGSHIFDMIITSAILMYFNSIFIYFNDMVINVKNKINKLFSNFSFTSYNEVKLIGVNSSLTWDNILDFSDRFLAMNDYIINNLKTIKKVKFLKEEIIKNNHLDNDKFHTLVLNHDNFLKLNDNIDIKYEINRIDYDDEKKNNSNNKKIDKTEIAITIRSKNLQVFQINDFIDKITNIFLENSRLKSIKNQYFFEFEKMDEDGYCNFSETIFSSKRSFNSIFFDKKDEFITKFKNFKNNKEWYDDREIPWHFGLLLHGKPGCGKTSIVKAMAKENKDHIISIPLSRVKTSKDLSKIFHCEKINRHDIPMEKRIYLFEDIDAMNFSLNREENKNNDKELLSEDKKLTEEDKLRKIISSEGDKLTALNSIIKDEDPVTLSHFLNLIDGLLEMPGRKIILTTNHIEKLDPALIRPGRIDIEIEMKMANRNSINELYKWFYKKGDISNKKLIKIPENKFTPAEINNIFYRYNLNPEKALSYLTNE